MIPVKPQTETWTDAQWQAIWQRDSDILVSAAAGSGKTAVLIRRLIEKITDPANPISVDELLVVTFTNAAAAEMRHRLADALDKAIQNNPDSLHLREQLHLLNKAQISTLHSFCLQIIRQHGYLIDIDPGFRLASENESVLLQEDALEEIIEEAYENDQEKMYRLADSFSSDRSDRTLETLIVQLYSYSRVHPEPASWLSNIPLQYNLASDSTVDELIFTDDVKQAIVYRIQTALSQNELYRSLALTNEGLEKLTETADQDAIQLRYFQEVAENGSWEDLYGAFQKLKWATAKAVRGEFDPEAKEQAQLIRDQYKKDMSAVKDYYFARTPKRLLEEMRLMHPILETLVNRVKEFSNRYDEKKAQRSLLDFSDLEHRAYEILTTNDGSKRIASEIAATYRRKFQEVLVDEYQDINLLQESIIQLVKRQSPQIGNLFMVGDVKQSIYRFRLAEPMLFLDKYERFKKDTKTGVSIDLNANFRSRKEVLQGINFVFEQIMGKDVGEIAYDEDASLKQGAPYNEVGSPVEVHILSKDQDSEDVESLSKARAEAEWTARKIKQLLAEGHPVHDPWSGASRPAEFRDMVVLMRSMTWTAEFVEVFKQHQIPLFVETKSGFYDAMEIKWLVEVLRAIDNPYQDIPLVAVLRSPMIGLSDEELALLRASDRKAPYYELIQNRQALHHLSRETSEKIDRFIVLHRSWQKRSQSGPLAELIWQIYQDTYIFEQVAAMPGGRQRQSNLRMLIDQAEQFEKSSYRGVFRFLRFIERLRKRGDDVGEARAISERENVTRIMTIHASKGLEFPFVFLPGLARSFNMMDFKENYLFDQHYGLAVKAIDPDLRIAYQSLPFIAMKEKKQLQTKAEEMRILYVAMTRAREKLFLSLSIPSLDVSVQKWQSVGYLQSDAPVPPFMRSNAMSYWDWLGPAFIRMSEFQQLTGIQSAHHKSSNNNWHFEVHGMEEQEALGTHEQVQNEEILTGNLDQWTSQLKQTFEFQYAHEVSTKKTAKQTVTELKRLQQFEEQDEDFFSSPAVVADSEEWEIPAFLSNTPSASAASRGTAYHSVFQHIPITESFSSTELLERLKVREILTAEEVELIDPLAIDAFVGSELMKELRKAKQIFRELPFTYSAEDSHGNRQIIQGVIDLFFEDDLGYWHLIDFKTDALYNLRHDEKKWQTELKNRYRVQMSLYGQAIEQILSVKLASTRIYSIPFQATVAIEEEHQL